MDEKKVYKSTVRRVEARPRSKRLRELGVSGSVAGGGTVVNVIGQGGGVAAAGDGHTHGNKSVLDKISADSDGYMYLTQLHEVTEVDEESGEERSYWKSGTEKVRAGEADHAASARDLDEESNANERFLRKDGDDGTEYGLQVGGLLELLTGAGSPGFTSGLLGSGFSLIRDEGTGRWRMEIDDLTVRQLATFFELVIKRMKHVGGSIVLTPASMECIRVEETEGGWRCYFKASDGSRGVVNEFVAGDLVRCQSFNLRSLEGGSNGVRTAFYWRLVTAVEDDWIELSADDCAEGSGVPAVGDTIVQLGNRGDASRQHAIVMDTTGPDAPSFKQYRGIDGYSLDGKEITVFSNALNKIKGRFVSEVTGMDLDDTLELWSHQMESMKAQTDRTMIIWFDSHVPSNDNLPASDWTTEDDKKAHEEDMYYCREDGRAYRYALLDSGYGWMEITDADTIRALEKASQAQDTADGKRRNFTAQPTDEHVYDVGDFWCNATYPEDGSIYRNDMLRCVTAKKTGESFDIAHWKPVNEATTAKIETLTVVDAEGNLKSQVKVSADQIIMNGEAIFTKDGDVDESGTAIDGGKIKTELIDTKRLVVNNLEAKDENGNVSCSIDGKSGVLKARGADIEGKLGPFYTDYNGFYTEDADFLIYETHRCVLIRNNSSYARVGGDAYDKEPRVVVHNENKACEFVSGNYGLKVTSEGVFKTSDGGSSWTSI